ncbi:hypothetical protein GCM10010198_69330 [Nocardia seriolae]
MVDVGVLQGFSWELVADAFEDARVAALSSGWVGASEDLGEGVGEPVRGKNPLVR